MIGRAEALDFLAPQPVGLIWGVGAALQTKLEQDGIRTIADLRERDEVRLMKRYGVMGRRLYRFARGEDLRTVDPDEETKSISAETTFARDIAELDELQHRLWPLCETVARRMKAAELAGGSVVLKLKTADFKQVTRSRKLATPTQMADAVFHAVMPLLEREAVGPAYRLIGVGCADLAPADRADPPDLLDPERLGRVQVEQAMDTVRTNLGDTAVVKGRGFTPMLPGLERLHRGVTRTGVNSASRRRAPASAARPRDRLQLFQHGRHGEVAVVDQHGLGDTVFQQAQTHFILGRRFLAVDREEGHPDRPDNPLEQLGVEAVIMHQVLAQAEHGVDLRRPFGVGAVEHRGREHLVTGCRVAQQLNRMHGREHGAAGQFDLLRFRLEIAGDARPVFVGLGGAAQFLVHLTVDQLADIEPVGMAVLRLPRGVVGRHVDLIAFRIKKTKLEALFDGPAVTGVAPLEHHLAAHVGNRTAAPRRGQRHLVDRPMRGDLDGGRSGKRRGHEGQHADRRHGGGTDSGSKIFQGGDHKLVYSGLRREAQSQHSIFARRKNRRNLFWRFTHKHRFSAPENIPMNAPNGTEHPVLLLTRRFPDAVMTRAARDYRIIANDDDHPYGRDEIIGRAAGADALLVSAVDPIPADLIRALPDSVRMIATFSVGTDHIDLAAARERGIAVSNTPGVLTDATADIAFLLLLGAARRASEGERLIREGRWEGWVPLNWWASTSPASGWRSWAWAGSVRPVARRARGFDMEIHYRNRRRLADAEEAAPSTTPMPTTCCPSPTSCRSTAQRQRKPITG